MPARATGGRLLARCAGCAWGGLYQPAARVKGYVAMMKVVARACAKVESRHQQFMAIVSSDSVRRSERRSGVLVPQLNMSQASLSAAALISASSERAVQAAKRRGHSRNGGGSRRRSCYDQEHDAFPGHRSLKTKRRQVRATRQELEYSPPAARSLVSPGALAGRAYLAKVRQQVLLASRFRS